MDGTGEVGNEIRHTANGYLPALCGGMAVLDDTDWVYAGNGDDAVKSLEKFPGSTVGGDRSRGMENLPASWRAGSCIDVCKRTIITDAVLIGVTQVQMVVNLFWLNASNPKINSTAIHMLAVRCPANRRVMILAPSGGIDDANNARDTKKCCKKITAFLHYLDRLKVHRVISAPTTAFHLVPPEVFC